MTSIVGLFTDEQKAEKAIENLGAAEALADVEFKTISKWEREAETKVALVAGLGSGTTLAGVPVAATSAPSWGLDDEETEYFKRTVQRGGVLVVVDVNDDDQVPQVRRILQETGEKVTVSS